jgi:hypothetical protein
VHWLGFGLERGLGGFVAKFRVDRLVSLQVDKGALVKQCGQIGD